MAYMDVEFPDDFMQELLGADFDTIAEDALKEATDELVKAMKTSCKNSIDHEGDSELANSIRASKPKKTADGAWVVNVGPRGYSKKKTYYGKNGKGVHTGRKYPVSNALKAIWKEYGIPGHQSARPFIQKAVNDSKASVEKKLQDIYDRKVGNNGP